MSGRIAEALFNKLALTAHCSCQVVTGDAQYEGKV